MTLVFRPERPEKQKFLRPAGDACRKEFEAPGALD
jgi:hypothetical protein